MLPHWDWGLYVLAVNLWTFSSSLPNFQSSQHCWSLILKTVLNSFVSWILIVIAARNQCCLCFSSVFEMPWFPRFYVVFFFFFFPIWWFYPDHVFKNPLYTKRTNIYLQTHPFSILWYSISCTCIFLWIYILCISDLTYPSSKFWFPHHLHESFSLPNLFKVYGLTVNKLLILKFHNHFWLFSQILYLVHK